MRRKSKNHLKRVLILSGIFFAALVLYFVWSFVSMEKSNTIYSAMDEPRMPVVYAEMGGIKMNPMHAYVQDMGNRAARDSVTVLPQDRQLRLLIDEYDSMAVSVQYEIRSLDLTRLLENGSVSEIARENGQASLVLPIQNLIEKDRQYLLKLTLDTGEQLLNYYTRILWTDSAYASEMVALAQNFTEKSFDYNAARELTTYLEASETADNSSLGHVTIQSNFTQLTWGGTGMQPDGALLITLKECSGVMGEVQIRYQTSRTTENGREERFQNEDNFVLRYDPQRIFIMDFDRKTEEIFSGQTEDFSGGRILLGINNPEELQTKISDSGRYLAFKTNRELWSYDQEERTCVNIFTYRSQTDDGVRSGYEEHDIKILRCSDNGNVDFLVYGYINRGRHEGYNGVVYYTYDAARDMIEENFFVPIADVYEQIAADVEKLAYIGGQDMLYFLQQGSVYGADTNSLEVITVTSGLEEGAYATSAQGDRIAWQSSADGKLDRIMLADLQLDKTSEIQEADAYERVLGFIGDDLVYGVCDRETEAESTAQISALPIRELRIVGPDLELKNSYQREGAFLSNVQVEANRVRFDLVSRLEDGSYLKTGEDTIVSNREIPDTELEQTGNYIDSQKGRVYFVGIKDLGKKQVRTRAVQTVSYENASSVELNNGGAAQEEPLFYAYERGHFAGVRRTLGEAVALVYNGQGWVTDAEQNILWNRTDKETIVTVKDPQDKASSLMLGRLDELGPYNRYDDGLILMDASGIDLNSALYYLGKGLPVIAYNADGGYYLISAYDQFNVTLINPLNGEKQLMGKNDAQQHFEAQGNRFVVGVMTE